MNFIIYNQNGQILRVGSCPDIDFHNQAIGAELILEGVANQSTQYIKNGKVVDLPEKPNDYYKFDYITKQWIFDAQLATATITFQRNQLLFASDWTQLPDVSLINKSEWATYRQALRDIPQQEGFPENALFPIAPTN